MSWRLEWSRPAVKDMRQAGTENARRVREALVRYAETGHGDVRRLTGVNPPEWRLRVGSWRVLFTYGPEAGVLTVLRVLPRGEAYR